MYCPECLNDSLEIAEKGTVKVVVSGKMRDNGVFFFNTERDTEDEITQSLKEKLTDFCKWYSNFQNQEPVLHLVLSTRDAHCRRQCVMPSSFHTSVIDVLISKERVQEIVDEVAPKFGFNMEIKDIDDEVA